MMAWSKWSDMTRSGLEMCGNSRAVTPHASPRLVSPLLSAASRQDRSSCRPQNSVASFCRTEQLKSVMTVGNVFVTNS